MKMVIAIAMVKVVPEKEKPAYHALKDIDGVRNLYHIFGDYDFLLVLQSDGMDMLAQMIKEIRGISHVTEADTLLVGKADCDCKEINRSLMVLA